MECAVQRWRCCGNCAGGSRVFAGCRKVMHPLTEFVRLFRPHLRARASGHVRLLGLRSASAVVSALAAAAMPSLKLAESSSTKHKEVVTGVDWSAANELLSVSDDKTVWLWNIDGEPQAQILTIDSFCTGLLWAPGATPTNEAPRNSLAAHGSRAGVL